MPTSSGWLIALEAPAVISTSAARIALARERRVTPQGIATARTPVAGRRIAGNGTAFAPVQGWEV